MPNLATPVCAAFQKSGIELVRFGKGDDEHSNLLPVFGEICNFVDKRLREKKSVLFWETGGGAASLVAYGTLRNYLIAMQFHGKFGTDRDFIRQ